MMTRFCYSTRCATSASTSVNASDQSASGHNFGVHAHIPTHSDPCEARRWWRAHAWRRVERSGSEVQASERGDRGRPLHLCSHARGPAAGMRRRAGGESVVANAGGALRCVAGLQDGVRKAVGLTVDVQRQPAYCGYDRVGYIVLFTFYHDICSGPFTHGYCCCCCPLSYDMIFRDALTTACIAATSLTAGSIL